MSTPLRKKIAAAVSDILDCVDPDPSREGLVETPRRVASAYLEEWCGGYLRDPREVLKVFNDGGEDYTGILFQGSIPVYSLCEHHLAAIFGVAHFAYIPDGCIVGLSKIPRLIDVFAKRLQVQERMTRQIVDAFHEIVRPRGCGLVMELRHLCMESRGVRLPGTITRTSDLRGIFLQDPSSQQEFMDLVRMEGARR